MKITFLGDSLTWGGFGSSYIDMLRQRLPDYSITNAGEGGDTVINLRRRLDAVLAEAPDMVFVMVGGNDAISFTQPGTRPYYKTTKKLEGGMVTPEQFAAHYRDLLADIAMQQVGAVVGLPPVEYSPELQAAVQHYNHLARDVAESMSVPVLDLEARLRPDAVPDRPPVDLRDIQLIGQRVRAGWHDYEAERQRLGYTYTFDGLHLMPQAAQLMADAIADFLTF